MQIAKEVLAEKNYEGSRLIELNDEKVTELQKEITALQIEANPFLAEMEKLTPILDPFYQEIGKHQKAIDDIKEEMAKPKEEYMEWLQKVEKIDQKANLVKNKLQPLVKAIIAPQLGEFETARTLTVKDGKLYVEVVDEIEEKVKAIRANKQK